MPRPRSAPDLYLLTKVSTLYYLRDQTQQQIADLLGLNVIHLNHVLRRLRGRQLVAITGRKVTLQDIPALQRLAAVQPARQSQTMLL